MNQVRLVKPSLETLPSYKAALERGWSADNIRGLAAAEEELARIAEDPEAFVASMDHMEPSGATIRLPDGREVPRLPGFRRWLWDGEACGSIGFRWRPGSNELPPYVYGHIGYAVVPWKQRLGYATQALALILPEARAVGLDYVELTTDIDNIASRKVIETNGGLFVETFLLPGVHGEDLKVRYRIPL